MYPNHCSESRGCGGGVCCIPHPKPPVGLLSNRIWLEHRYAEVTRAIKRYKDAGLEVPNEWYDEYFQLNEKLG